MQKILVIDDNPENLSVAKTFFSGIKGYEFIFAANRKEAEERLEEAFAVITDRDMPYDVPNGNKEIENGYQIAIWAAFNNKPVTIASAHGGLRLMSVMKNHPKFIETGLKTQEIFGRAFHPEVNARGERDIIVKPAFRGGLCPCDQVHSTLEKDNIESWKIAWQHLKNQF